jgi:hypothetical protein
LASSREIVLQQIPLDSDQIGDVEQCRLSAMKDVLRYKKLARKRRAATKGATIARLHLVEVVIPLNGPSV